MACDYETEYKCGDGEHNLLKKILGRLKQLAVLAGGGGGVGDTVTLTVSDIEIGAVEIKDGDTDARAKVITTCPDPADRGLVVRNIICGTQPISAVFLPLPGGAATEATLSSVAFFTQSVDNTLVQRLPSLGFDAIIQTVCPVGTDPALVVRNIPCGTQAISAASLPLPAGAATEATLVSVLSELATSNFYLGDMNSLIRSTCPSGADLALAVRNIPCGTQAISAVSLPLPTGAASDANLAVIRDLLTNIDLYTTFYFPNFDSSLSVIQNSLPSLGFDPLIRTVCPSGADPALAVRNIPCGTQAVSGPFLTEASFLARTNTLGQKNMSGSMPVVIASDQSAVAVTTKTNLTASAPTAASVGVASAQAVASNANRKGLILVNTSANRISLGIGSAAVLNSGITLDPGDSWAMDEYSFSTAAINAIASVAASNLAIQEFTT